jgi:molybdopterin-guanine dinucleotide biosynthesis protein A
MGTDKALLVLDGELLAERVAGVLEAAGCSPVVFVGGDETALTATGRRYVPDRWPGEGPVGGILTALTAITDDAVDGVVVAACDLVALTPDAVRAVMAGAGSSAAPSAVTMADSGRLEPLLAYWPLAVTDEVARRFPAVRAVHELAGPLGARRARVPAAALRNANRPSDLPR